MAHHSPTRDNYVQKKSFAEAMGEADTLAPDLGAQDADKKARATSKGGAANNGSGDKNTV